jgi:putative ABC transport system permease protein
MFSIVNIRVGFYLALRQLRRASRWTTSLIVFVMLLTFLNLVVVTGLLVGIVAGISNQFRIQQTGDVMITALDTKDYIENSPQILSFLHTLPQPQVVSARYSTSGTIEANYYSRTDFNEKPNKTGASIVGIDPFVESDFSNLSSYIGEGSYLAETDYDAVLLGPQFVDRYSFGEQPGLTPLKNVYPGTKIRLTINNHTREVVVKGILDVPANSPLAAKVFMPASEVRQLMGRDDYAVNEIAVLLKEGTDGSAFRDLLKRSGVGDKAKVQTFEEGIPNGVAEVQNTFAMIGNAIGSIGLVVAAITIFIVIFINAITRRKFIGILKGIGISGEAIEISYVFQSLFYAAIGSVLGMGILYGFLVPYVSANPISLPISEAIIVAPLDGTMIRIGLIVLTTIIAGYLPSRMIVRKNTLDSILGRN